jgi:hypothetical protein
MGRTMRTIRSPSSVIFTNAVVATDAHGGHGVKHAVARSFKRGKDTRAVTDTQSSC